MAQPVFVATASSSSQTGTSMTINKPTGTVDGDLMIAYFSGAVTGNTMTTLAGWTAISQLNTNDQSHFFYKIASSEGSNYTWTHWNANNNVIIGTITTFRNSNQTSPYEFITAYDSSSDTTATGSALTTATAPDTLLCMFVASYYNGTTSISGYAVANNNPTWTEAYDISGYDTFGGDNTQAMAYAQYPYAGSTGTPTATLANAGTARVSLLLIRPTGLSIAPDVFTGVSTMPDTSANIGISIDTFSATTYLDTGTPTEGTPKWRNENKDSSTWGNESKT